MQVKTLLVTGESVFLSRHEILFKALMNHFQQVSFLSRQAEWFESTIPRVLLKGVLTLQTGSQSRANSIFQKNKTGFIFKSKRAEREIQNLPQQPDLVFQVFGTYRPCWQQCNVPYVLFLDYTTALAERNWPAWATFLNSRSRLAWFECERSTYHQAIHIFCMSHLVKNSLIQDYGLDAEQVTVVGSSGDFEEPYTGRKTFGTRQILFNGSDFERKGGTLLLEAFEQVKQVIPDTELVIIGKKLTSDHPGVSNPGHIATRDDLHQLFLGSDLVVAPAYCDPFPTFLMEAMNYGVPCLVSNRDGMPEIVDNGVNGIVLEPLTSEALATAIIDLLQNPDRLSQFSRSAREKMRTQLNWAIIASQIAKKILDLPATAEVSQAEEPLSAMTQS